MSSGLDVRTNLEEQPWRDLPIGPLITYGEITRIGVLPDALIGGQPSVTIVAESGSGDVILVETSWALFRSAFEVLSCSATVLALE